MLRFLDEKASDLGLKLPKSPVDVVRLSRLIGILPDFVKAVSLKPLITDVEIATDFNFPIEFVQSFSNALQESFVTEQPTYVIPTYPEYVSLLNTAGTVEEIKQEPRKEQLKVVSVTQETRRRIVVEYQI